MKQKGDTKKNGRFFTAVSILLIVVGLALVLYPIVANQINQAANGKVIEEYRQKVELTDESEYEQILADVREYNEELAKVTPYIADLTKEMRERYESLLNVGGNGIIGYIEIPKADVYLAIYHGTEESVLQTGVGHLEGSSLPAKGESVHTVLTGHSGLPSARLFSDIDRLEIGDTFELHILRETLTYQVESIRRVEPEELKNLHIDEGQEICTLMTCTPYGINTHRLVVTGRRIETPTTEKSEGTPIVQAVTSKWNQWFVFLPVVLFMGIGIAVILICKHKKKKKLPNAALREEET